MKLKNILSTVPEKIASISMKPSLARIVVVLCLSFFARHAVAQQDCHQACSNFGGPALCGTSCTFVDSSGFTRFSFCGSNDFPLCTPPPPTPTPTPAPGASPSSGSTQLSSFL